MRFLVFVYSDYYPRGGWNDFLSSKETLEEAKALGEKELAVGPESVSTSTKCRQHQEFIVCRPCKADWVQVVDALTLDVFELASPDGYCPLCGPKPVYPQWSHQVSPEPTRQPSETHSHNEVANAE